VSTTEAATRGYAAAYCGLVAATVLLPSAKLQDFNVKFALAGALLLCGAFAWRGMVSGADAAARLGRLHLAIVAYLGAVVAGWSGVGISNGFDPLPEVRSILGPLFLVAAYHPRLVPKRWLLDVYCASAIAYSIVKLALLLGVYLGVVKEFDLVQIGRSVFDMELVGGPTCTAGLRRLALPNDLAVAMFPLLLLDHRYRRPWVYAAMALCGLAVLSSYSRYFMLAFIVIGLVIAWQLASIRPRTAVAAALFAMLAIAYAVDGGNCLLPRFMPAANAADSDADAVTVYSDGRSLNLHTDSVRREQFARLKALIAEKPLMGHGVGSYDPGYVRSKRMPYSYELQLLSFVSKFGLIGFALLTLGAGVLCALLFGRNIAAWAVVATLAASGVANPFYESSAFGVAFVLTVVAFSRWPNTD